MFSFVPEDGNLGLVGKDGVGIAEQFARQIDSHKIVALEGKSIRWRHCLCA